MQIPCTARPVRSCHIGDLRPQRGVMYEMIWIRRADVTTYAQLVSYLTLLVRDRY